MIKVFFLLLFLFISCSSGEVKIVKNFQEKKISLGLVEGEACGTLFGGPTGYNFIPILLNSRVERAYEKAITKIPGTKELVNISIQESWFWALSFYKCTTIRGEAVKWE